MLTPIAVSGVLYVTPRLATHFSTHPQNIDRLNRIDKIRDSLASLYDSFAYEFGRHNLSLVRCVVLDNAWLGSLITAYMLPVKGGLLLPQAYAMGMGVLGLSTAIFFYRLGLSKATASFSPTASRFLTPNLPPPKIKLNLYPGERKALTALIERDYVLNRFICPITYVPIRKVVEDRKTNTLYEREAIRKWLLDHGTSPMSRAPLRFEDLQEAPGVQAIISARIAKLSRILQAQNS